MTKRLNWKKNQTIKNWNTFFNLLLITIGMVIFTNPSDAQDMQDICKMKGSYIDMNTGDTIPSAFIYVGPAEVNGVVGGDYPCDAKIAISVEDQLRYIFHYISAFNATMAPNDSIDYPEDSIGINGKRATNWMSNTKSFERVKDLKVGYIDGSYGERWAITANQLKRLYPNSTFDIQLGGKPATAFDQSNLFFEMLISIQVLAHKNETLTATVDSQQDAIDLLTERLDRLENALNNASPTNPNKTMGKVSINPNPNTNGVLNIAYDLYEQTSNDQLVLTDIQGKVLYQIKLANTSGNEKINIDLAPGNYLYFLRNNKQQTIAQKITIQ